MLYGRFVGIILTILGVILSGIGYAMLMSRGSTLQFFVAGPSLCLVGIAMLIMPGGPLTLVESKHKGFNAKAWMRDAPMLHKIVWGIALIVGLVIAFQFVEI